MLVFLRNAYAEPADHVALENGFQDLGLDWLVKDDIPRPLRTSCATVTETRRYLDSGYD